MFGGERPNNNSGGINRPFRNPMLSNQTTELQQLRQALEQTQNGMQQMEQELE